MADNPLSDALDTGFKLVMDLAGEWHVADAADVLSKAEEIVAENPRGAACAIFAYTAESSENINLKWLFSEWQRAGGEPPAVSGGEG
jgi:hypothetical protein